MKKNIKILILCLFISISSYGQQTKTDANVFGHVICEGEHIPGINIYIKGTQIGTATDKTGHYFLYNLPVGKHILVAAGLGFSTSEKEVEIKAGQTIEIDFELLLDVIMKKEVVISASRVEQNRRETPVFVNVISQQMLHANNSLNLAEGLAFQTGLRVENNCQNCGFQQVRINGLEGPYSQILVNGRPIFSALSGVYGLEQIPSSMVDRIEVVKGGGSATYGSNAIAGTINIITKEPLYNSFQVGHHISAFDKNTFDNNTSFHSTLLNNGNSGGITIFGNVRDRHSFDYNKDGFTEIPKLTMSSMGFHSFFRLSNQSKLTAEYHQIEDFRRGGNKLGLPPHLTDITEQIEHSVHSGSMVYEYLLPENNGKFSVFNSFRSTDRKSYYGTGMDPLAYGISKDLVYYVGSEYVRRFSKSTAFPQLVLFGADYTYNDLIDRLLGYNRLIAQTTHNAALFAQGEWKIGAIKMLTGLRADKHNMIDRIVINPRLNMLTDLSEQLQLRAGFATGFRAPQVFDEDLHIASVGGEVQIIQVDPDLSHENSQSYTASLDYYPKVFKNNLNIVLSGFYTQLHNTFVLEHAGNDAQGNMILERTNAEGALVYGSSFEVNYSLANSIIIQSGITLQQSLYREEIEWSDDPKAERTKQMLRTPDLYGMFGIIYSHRKNIDVSFSGVYTGSMLVPRYAGYVLEDKLVKTEDFIDINLKVSRNIKLPRFMNLEVAVGAKNILNSYQKEFDKGPDRDAGFMYGPIFPRHIYMSVVFGNKR